ncbi:MAG: class I SAM-dependent methyltransferase [Nitrincola lacisaponensis]|uniref:class I SAM-dependent methyltransferase n=1 Tax=Nitrincola lacisaponensis TaxID=267850 RepID=UPI00391940F0
MNSHSQQTALHPAEAIRHWYATPLGQEVAACERKMADTLVHGAFGYHLVQVGYDPSVRLFDASPVSHKVMLCPQMVLGMDEHSLVAEANELPLADSSLDVVILHHALDFAEHPHQVLREASRVLRPGGHLLVVSFNPASFWGLCRRFHAGRPLPWAAQGFSHWRLHDWMRLLDLTELKSVSDFHQPPIENARWYHRLGFLGSWVSRLPTYSGVVLMMWVRKDVMGMTPLKPAWKTRKLISFPVAEPSARHKSARGKSV